MKKNIKRLFLIFIFVFLIMPVVKAENPEDAIGHCYYNFNRLSPNHDAAKDAYFQVDIYDDDSNPGKPVYAIGYSVNDFDGELPQDPVLNWGGTDDPIDAQKYYLANGCPPFALYYRHNVLGNEELLLFDSSVNMISYVNAVSAFRSDVYTFGLIDVNESVETSETCKYGSFDINYNEKNKIVSIKNNTSNNKEYLPTLNTTSSSESVELCQPVYVCKQHTQWVSAPRDELFIFYSEYEELDYYDEDCKLYEPTENKAKNGICLTFSNFLNGNSSEGFLGMRDHWRKYNECKENNDQACVSEEIGLYNYKKSTLKTYCNSILGNKNVTDPCVEKCLDLNKEIDFTENSGSTDGTETCGFSQNLIIWIANIVRWVKYIIPAIVIVLGIIDFIKAIAGDKDDEMKKAQGRFIKRLVAAALIFIIPFIIEFILDKMGFASNGCGIIDL